MKVIEQYVYKHKNGSWQILYRCQDDLYFTTDTGAFGQRDMSIIPIGVIEAETLISAIKKNIVDIDTL